MCLYGKKNELTFIWLLEILNNNSNNNKSFVCIFLFCIVLFSSAYLSNKIKIFEIFKSKKIQQQKIYTHTNTICCVFSKNLINCKHCKWERERERKKKILNIFVSLPLALSGLTPFLFLFFIKIFLSLFLSTTWLLPFFLLQFVKITMK